MININGTDYDTASAEPEDWASFAIDGKTQAQIKREAFSLYREAKRIELETSKPRAVTVEKTQKEIDDEKMEIAEKRLKNINKIKKEKK